jgi:four helix bundle protein
MQLMGRDFRTLDIWNQAYNLVLDIYPLLDRYPDTEGLNLVDRMRHAATSLPVLIAEGAGGQADKVFFACLDQAFTSTRELDVLLLLSRDLGYIEDDIHRFIQRKLEKFTAELRKSCICVKKTELLRCGEGEVSPDATLKEQTSVHL